MSDPAYPAARGSLSEALRLAYAARLGVPRTLEPLVRGYAREARVAGVPVEQMLIDLKALVRALTADHAPLYVEKVVGWAVAGYFAGTRTAQETSADD